MRETRSSRAPWLVWALCALALALIACAVGLGALNAYSQGVSYPLAMTASVLVGGLVASRRPANPVGWLFLASATCVALNTITFEYAAYGLLESTGELPFAGAMARFSVATEPLGPALMLVVLPFFFPDGRLVSPAWRPVFRLVVLVLMLGLTLRFLMPGVFAYGPRFVIPLGVEALRPYLDALSVIGTAMWLGSIVVAVASLVVRFNRSRGEERQQIKWLAFAALMIPVWFGTNAPIEAAAPNLFQVVDALIVFTLIPVAAGVAILKHRLYAIDVLINRTLVYGPLTAMLIVVYLGGGVVSLQYAFRMLTGQGSQIAIVASTLAIAALFNPLRHRVQAFVDRRFYRSKYDAAKTLTAFNSRLREETDLNALTEDVISVMRETLQPAHVSLWLRSDSTVSKDQRSD